MMRYLLCALLVFAAAGELPSDTIARDMRRLVRRPFTVYYPVDQEAFARFIANSASEAGAAVAAYLGLELQEPVTLIIAGSDGEFSRITGGAVPEWGAAAAFPEQSLICMKAGGSGEKQFRRIVSHEIAHILLHRAAGGRQTARWFDEGFAELTAPAGLADVFVRLRAFSLGGTIDLADIDDILTFRREKAGLAYTQSRAAVEYLLQEHGEQSIGRIVALIAAGRDFESAFSLVTGMSVSDFQDGWLRVMKSRYRWGFLFHMSAMPGVLLAGVFIAVFAAARRRRKKQNQEWEKEEHDLEEA